MKKVIVLFCLFTANLSHSYDLWVSNLSGEDAYLIPHAMSGLCESLVGGCSKKELRVKEQCIAKSCIRHIYGAGSIGNDQYEKRIQSGGDLAKYKDLKIVPANYTVIFHFDDISSTLGYADAGYCFDLDKFQFGRPPNLLSLMPLPIVAIKGEIFEEIKKAAQEFSGWVEEGVQIGLEAAAAYYSGGASTAITSAGATAKEVASNIQSAKKTYKASLEKVPGSVQKVGSTWQEVQKSWGQHQGFFEKFTGIVMTLHQINTCRAQHLYLARDPDAPDHIIGMIKR